MSLLTTKQKQELNLAIADYLSNEKLTSTLESFLNETQVSLETLPIEHKGILEKKWTSILRLQKKVMELEQRVNNDSPSSNNKQSQASFFIKNNHKTQFKHKLPVNCVEFNPVFSSVIVTGSDDCLIRIYDLDLENSEPECVLRGHTKPIQDLCFNAHGNLLVSCSSDLSIKIWDSSNEYSCIRTLFGHDHTVSSVMVEGDFVVSCSRDKTVKKWEISTGFCLKTFSGNDSWVRCIDLISTSSAVASKRTLLASGSDDMSVKVWDFESGQSISEMRGHEHFIEDLKFIPPNSNSLISDKNSTSKTTEVDCRYLVSCSRDKNINLWNWVTEECLNVLKGHDNWVRGLSIVTGSKLDEKNIPVVVCYVYSVSDDKSIKIWDISTGGGKVKLLTGSVDTEVRLWESK